MPETTKKRRVTSVTIMIICIVLLFLAALCMFFPNIITPRGGTPSAADIFWPGSKKAYDVNYNGIWPVFIGYMFIFLCGVGTLIIALPVIQITYKLEKILLITFTALEVVGAILVALINVFYCGLNDYMAQLMDTEFYWGAYLAVIFTLVAAGLNIFALYLDK